MTAEVAAAPRISREALITEDMKAESEDGGPWISCR